MDNSEVFKQNPSSTPVVPNIDAATPILKWPLPAMARTQNNDPGTPITEIADFNGENMSETPCRAKSDAAFIRQIKNQPPELPPRLNTFTAGTASGRPITTLQKTSSNNGLMKQKSKSSLDKHHTLSLVEFARCYSKRFPVRIKVTEGFYGHTNHGTLSGQEELIVLFEKRREVLRIKSQLGKTYSLPLSSSIPLSLLYNPHGKDSEALQGTTFSMVSDIKSVSAMPKIISATKAVESQDKTVSVTTSEVLVVQTFDPVSHKLKVRSLPRDSKPSSVKELPLECYGEFTTNPRFTALYPSDIVNYVHFSQPSESTNTTALVHFSRIPRSQAKTVQVNDKSLQDPVQLLGFFTEDSLIAVRDIQDSNIESHQLLEIPLDGTLPIEITYLESLANQSHSNYRSKFDPTQLNVWGIDTCEESQVIQRIFNSTLRPGHEMEGILISEQIYDQIGEGVTSMEPPKSPENEPISLLPIPDGSSSPHKPLHKLPFPFTQAESVVPTQSETVVSSDPLPDDTSTDNKQTSAPVADSPVLVAKGELVDLVSTAMRNFLASNSPPAKHLRLHSTSSDGIVADHNEVVFASSLSRERDKLSSDDLCEIVSELVECEGLWYLLAIYMGVPKTKVDQISATHSNDSNLCRRGLLDGVSYWLDNTANPTWSGITKALYKLDKKNLARRIAKQYGATLPDHESAEGLEDLMPLEESDVQKIKQAQKKMLEKSEELHDVDLRLNRNEQKLKQFQDELVRVRKRLDFNMEYTLTLDYGKRTSQWKKSEKENHLRTLEGGVDSEDARRKVIALKTEIGSLDEDISTYDTRLRNAQQEIMKLEQQLVFIGRQSDNTAKDFHSLQERKYSLTHSLNEQEDQFNHMITGNRGDWAPSKEPATDSTNLEAPGPEYYNIIIRNGKAEQRLHEKEVEQLQENLQEKEVLVQKLNSKLQQIQQSLADVERKVIAQQSTEYWYTDTGDDLVHNENLKTSLQADKVGYQLQIAATRLSKRDVKAKLDIRQRKLQQSKRRNEYAQAKVTNISKKSLSRTPNSKLSTSSEDTDVFISEPTQQTPVSYPRSNESEVDDLQPHSSQQRVTKPCRKGRPKLTSESAHAMDRPKTTRTSRSRAITEIPSHNASRTPMRKTAGVNKSTKPVTKTTTQSKRLPKTPINT